MGAPQYEQAGADIGGTGTTNTIPRWTGPSTLGDSGLIDDGSVIYTTARNAAFGSTSSAGYRARVLAAAGTGSAFGLRIDAGTNSTDYALRIANQATTSDYLAVRGDGNVGIGTASPAGKLDIADAASASVYISRPGLSAVYGAAGLGNLRWRDTANAFDAAQISAVGYFPGSNGQMTFSTAAGGTMIERMRIATNASQAASQVAIGTSSFTSGCSLTVAQSIDVSQSAQGLKLPATPGNADTQTLDCYQEGTWAPTLAGFGGTNPTVTATLTRVGRLVTLTVQMQSTGGAQYSGTLGATTLTVPAGMTPNIPACTNLVNGAVQNLGNVAAYNDGLIYLPTFALTTAFTFFVVTYRV